MCIYMHMYTHTQIHVLFLSIYVIISQLLIFSLKHANYFKQIIIVILYYINYNIIYQVFGYMVNISNFSR